MKRYFNKISKLVFGLCVVAVSACQPSVIEQANVVDENATSETKALFVNLKKISETNIMFGHQEDLAYGVNWIKVAGKSDVKDVCGDYPAVYGWDIGKEGNERNLDSVAFADVKQWIREAYQRGGVNTISWHVDNTTSNGNSWDTTQTVKHILPGGKDHEAFKARLDHVAEFLHDLHVGDVYVPVIFRPWHEHNGSWFWWGKGLCTEEEYIALWRFTVQYLRDVKHIHHVLYAFSPDRSRLDTVNLKASYLYGYPGDEYVDVIGFDNYKDVGISWNNKSKAQQQQDLIQALTVVSDIAKEKDKVAAFTETGLEGVTNPNWFTEVLLNPLKANRNIKLAYVMVWRNANAKHHYATYPGHAAAPDFVKFYTDSLTLFESDVQNLYQTGKPLTK